MEAVVSTLMECGYGDEVRRLGEEGDWGCASVWAAASADRGDVDAALAMLDPFADTGWWPAVVARNRLVADAEAHAAASAASAASPAADVRSLSGPADAEREPGRWQDDPEEELRFHLAGGWSWGLDDVAAARLDRLLARLIAEGREADIRNLLTEPGSLFIASRYASHLEQRGDRAAALDVLAVYAATPARLLLPEYTAMLTRAGRVEEAVDLLCAAAFDEAEPVTALPTLVRMTADHDVADRVLALIEEVANRQEGMTFPLREQRAGVLALRNETDAAIAELTDPDGPRMPPWWPRLHLAHILTNFGRRDEAIAILATIDDPGATIERATLLVRQGRVAEAITIARFRPTRATA